MATATRRRKPSAPAERLIAEVLKAQGAFFEAAKRPSEEFLRRAIDLPATFDPLDAETIREAQLAYQRMFQERSAERLRLGLRQAMAKPTRLTLIRALRARQRASTDPDVKVRLEQEIERRRREADPRREAVGKLLEQERRLAGAHAAAMAGRAREASRAVQVRAESPTGALWRRNPDSNSCDECRFLDGKLWPWEVLERISPPRHPNCQCTLIPVGAARAQGWIGPKAKVPSPKQGIHRARRFLQESIEGAVLVEAVRRGLFREVDVERDWHGRFDDEPGVSIGTSPLEVAARAYLAFWNSWSHEGIRVEAKHQRAANGAEVVTGNFMDAEGRKVGNFTRQFSMPGVVYHNELQTSAEAPPGLGTQFARDSMERYRADDRMRWVELTAGYSAGGYVWAREGAQPVGDWERLQYEIWSERILEVKAQMESAKVTNIDPEAQFVYQELYDRLKAGEFESIQEVAAFGRDHSWTYTRDGVEHVNWPGKAVLAGAEYQARFNVSGPAEPVEPYASSARPVARVHRHYATPPGHTARRRPRRARLREDAHSMSLWDLSTSMGLMLPPDPLDPDDRAFWDQAETLAEDFGLRRLFREGDVKRDFHGRFDDEPGAPAAVGTRAPAAAPRRAPETRLARTYAQAVDILVTGYQEKVDRQVRDATRGLVEAYDFLNTKATGRTGIEESREIVPGVTLNRYGWDTGDTKFSIDAFGEHGRVRDAGPELRTSLLADVQAQADKLKGSMEETQRRNIRGAIMNRVSERGRDAYAGLARAQEENNAEPRYAALRERHADIPERVIVVDEKGYARFPLGIADVFVVASRNVDNESTSVNGLAISVAVDHERMNPEVWNEGVGSRKVNLKPGADHMTIRSTAALLRHEWGHGLFDALPPEKREEFRAMLPPWDEVASGLSEYAAGTPETRADYDRRSYPYGYETETFAEMVALTGGSDYVPEQWPTWVQDLGKWIERLEP